MTQEIRRLLGGYATDTLSERERSELFEAAIEDQEVFDALQNDDALRELLADPATREELKAELRPVPRRRSWLFIGAGLAAAVITIAIVYWPRPAPRRAQPIQIASVQAPKSAVEPKIEQPPVERPAPKRRPRSHPIVAPPPASVQLATPLPQEPRAQFGGLGGGVVGGLLGPAPAALSLRTQDAAPNMVGNTQLYAGPLVRYSVLRSGPKGDEIRIEVMSQVAGNIALYRTNGAGQWERIYPSNGPSNAPGIQISADRPYRIPDAPITVRGSQNKLRLVIEPAEPQFRAQLTNSFAEQRATARAAAKPVSLPLVVEIPLGPN